ncbi:MAG: transketolase [Planctomycetia bacterium]|nr:transketolase [Planctomycetia bacterium]
MRLPLENLAINTIRTLSMDAVQAAKSGHPGAPMAQAPVAYLLYNERMKYNPAQPLWAARDRFVLSCGHASALLYSTLHLVGTQQFENGSPTGELAVRLEDLKNFRQLGSRCPGHPEFGHTSGVEITTGPLGQGLASSVGMAISAQWMAAKYNRDKDLFGFNVYALCGDGCMMEGVSSEAASLAAHLKLANLCWIYDDNTITIEGDTSLAFSEDVAKRFDAYGWNVLKVADMNDLGALRDALDAFVEEKERPTLIIVKSVIGFGSPNKAGSHDVHGAPLGEEEIRLTKQNLGWVSEESFFVPDEVREVFRNGVQARGAQLYTEWEADFNDYCQKYPNEAQEIKTLLAGALPEGWDAGIGQMWSADEKGTASRNSSGKVLNQLAQGIPWLLGGSADLAPSNKSNLTFPEAGDFSWENRAGRNFHFGVREFAMGAICNGIATCGLRSYGATFFVFCDYLRPAMRMSALMKLPVLYIFTHDSIGVGEDGPTHQPVEHLASLRAIPNMVVLRPADANEVRYAYRWYAENKTSPVALILTRQDLPTLRRSLEPEGDACACSCGVLKGAYVLRDATNPATNLPDAILMASGSEVHLCLDAQKRLAADGIFARVVSVPSMEIFERQTQEYKESVLPSLVRNRVAVEAGIELGWRKYLRCSGKFIGMDDFGASAPFKKLYEYFGITTDAIVSAVKDV